MEEIKKKTEKLFKEFDEYISGCPERDCNACKNKPFCTSLYNLKTKLSLEAVHEIRGSIKFAAECRRCGYVATVEDFVVDAYSSSSRVDLDDWEDYKSVMLRCPKCDYSAEFEVWRNA